MPRREASRPNSGRNSHRRAAPVAKAASATSAEAIKAAEQVALAAFGSGLRLAAAFGSVVAKTTSMALDSLATGADRFSDLVTKEAGVSTARTKSLSTQGVKVSRRHRKA